MQKRIRVVQEMLRQRAADGKNQQLLQTELPTAREAQRVTERA